MVPYLLLLENIIILLLQFQKKVNNANMMRTEQYFLRTVGWTYLHIASVNIVLDIISNHCKARFAGMCENIVRKISVKLSLTVYWMGFQEFCL